MMHSPSIINLMSPNSLFELTPPPQKSFQNNGNILHVGDNNNNHKTPRPSLTPPAPPNSEKLTMAIKLVESTLDEAIEDVRRVICIQEEEEAVRLEKQLLLLEEEVVAEEDAAKNRVARKYEAVVSSQRELVGDSAKLFTLEEDESEEEVEVEKEATDDIVSSLQSLDISCHNNEEDEEEEEIVISRPSAAATSRRQILDDSSDSSRNSSLDSEQDDGNNDDDDDQDFVMIDEEAIVFEKEDDESAASTSNKDDGNEPKEEETTKDDVFDGGFADLKITDDDGDDVSDVSFGQNNQFDDDSFTDERQEVHEESNDEDSLATANILQTPKDDNDDDSILLSFEGCGCWSLDNETGDLYLSSTTDNDNSDPKKKEKAKWPKIKLPLPLYNKLYQHQRIGVQWMASLHHDEIKGGLLADDMGLGKTMQVLTYLGSLMRAETICNAIIICPKSVVRSWEREANLNLKNICVPKATVTAVTSDMGKAKRKRVFEDAFCAPSKRPQLVITTYGLVSNHITDLTNISNTYEESRWCYVVLDEGHQIKNSSTKMSRDVRILASRSPHTRRLLMTGTPMQVSTNVF